MGRHRHPVGRDGGGKRSLRCVWNNSQYSRRPPPINNAVNAAQYPELATFLAAHREAIGPLALVNRRLEHGEIDTLHAAKATLAIIELYAP
jgi:hypothetical protein